jgi:hypothetical protein
MQFPRSPLSRHTLDGHVVLNHCVAGTPQLASTAAAALGSRYVTVNLPESG